MPRIEEDGFWVFREVSLCQHPVSQELLIVLLQMGEIAA
jgi:hypothetical protein